jgi:DsbC/DsbD-like thiol-disulfide interchange protein
MKLLWPAFLLSASLALPAVAGDPFVVPVTAQILPGWVKADGTRVAALHLHLEPGWKTYWRAPGDAGIPPTFDWSGSRNMRTVSISWPTPQVYDQNGMRTFVYSDELVIPLTIQPDSSGAPVHLDVEMDLGVCSDICVPHRLRLEGTIDTAERKPTPAIAAALAQRPFSASEAGVTAATCRFEPTADGWKIEARVTMPSAGGTEVMVIEPGLGDVWVGEAETAREGADLVGTSEMLHVSGAPFAIDRSAIRLTVLGGSHAVDIRGCKAG